MSTVSKTEDFGELGITDQDAVLASYLPTCEQAANRPIVGLHPYKGFRPLSDQVLVRPLPPSDRISSHSLIVIPGNHDRGRLDNKLGVVLALGPGDSVVPAPGDMSGHAGSRRWKRPHGGDRTQFAVAVGDTVLYAPRGWAEIVIDGETLVVLHDCQHVLAVVDPDAVLFHEDVSTKKKGPDWA